MVIANGRNRHHTFRPTSILSLVGISPLLWSGRTFLIDRTFAGLWLGRLRAASGPCFALVRTAVTTATFHLLCGIAHLIRRNNARTGRRRDQNKRKDVTLRPKHDISDRFRYCFNHLAQTHLRQVWLLDFWCLRRPQLVATRAIPTRSRCS